LLWSTAKGLRIWIAQQKKEVKLERSLHKVSSQIELMKHAPRVVANDQ